MKQVLRGLIQGMSDVTAIVGPRVDWGTRPQGDPYPGVSIHLISGILDIMLAKPGAWRDCRVQVDSWATTEKAADDIADLIERPAPDGLHGLRGVIGTVKLRIFSIDRSSDYHSTPSGIVYRTRIDLNVWWVRLP